MNMRKLIILSFLAALLTPLSHSLAENTKIGVVDMAKIFNTHPDTRTAEEAIEQKVKEFEQERKTLLEKFQSEKEAYDAARKDAQNKAWSQSVRTEKETLVAAKREVLRDLEQQMRETFEFRQKQVSDQRLRSRQRIIEKIKTLISAYAAKEGYTMILDFSETGASGLTSVVYHDGANNITDAILMLTRTNEEE
ncbi:MAG: OmpH family outer membrane protein [Kiritimatiellae bacterium]|nr:OmpH family outer membrane protein [Kiritimatiellia bacterium]